MAVAAFVSLILTLRSPPRLDSAYGQASGVPSPPPPPPAPTPTPPMGGWGLALCGEWSGRLGGVLLWAHRAGRDLTHALRKP